MELVLKQHFTTLFTSDGHFYTVRVSYKYLKSNKLKISPLVDNKCHKSCHQIDFYGSRYRFCLHGSSRIYFLADEFHESDRYRTMNLFRYGLLLIGLFSYMKSSIQIELDLCDSFRRKTQNALKKC